ncbi:T9SS C-terminal target domain-containing protein [Flavobacterium circumlabens]|uniref:Secreted protein (Por secretion system target) n=1 Tax=Flavobacterium circumlabens TaxID=2133765 RepID=A0A4Y7U8B1_9FLAO|nr:zinc-dependent metalloprotease family protein [Flavobacterium circumlabens]TCN53703.1 putative secreted protein (Por secretion system target) [Flavobacterium circumlabens]TEB42687.1 T9SS C-terminal target domain-containing protein [Flavobacterium circumlabens]
MKKLLLFIAIIFSCANVNAQNDALWQKVNATSVFNRKVTAEDSEKLYFKLNADFLKEKLTAATDKKSKSNTSEITVPNTNGVLERFTIWESSNFDPELQAKYPDIRAYEGAGIDDKSAKIHFSLSPAGLQSMVLRVDKSPEFIESNPDDKAQYVVFASKSTLAKATLNCSTKEVSNNQKAAKNVLAAKEASNNKVFKTLRLALSCTGEYTAYFGGTKAGALAAMNSTLTRVNGIFNRDLAIKLVLIANNDALIYTNAATDPYSNASEGTDGAWNQEVQTTLTNVIGNSAYDIGHLFGASGGGGNAGCIGCICVNPTASEPDGKGSGYTSPSNAKPEGDTFDIDFVIHEFGHQLGANHTFSYDGSERTNVNVEPGSGSTIMGYAGISEDYDVQNNSDDYFAYVSILQIQNTLSSVSCPVSTTLTNNPPTISAGPDYTIPKGTAFVLKGTGSDAEGNTITYCWEENDNATSTSGETSKAYPTKPDGALFRSFLPVSSPIRYMPQLDAVLQNKLSSTWESVSNIARTLNFTLTGRDNAAQGTAQTRTDAMVVVVNANAGPFAVTSQNTDNIGWANGSQQTISWSVNNTTALAGSANVNIKLSTDGGLTFPITLVSGTPNDGSEIITVPADIKATTCRLLIEPTANIYYAVNSNQFAIGYTVSTNSNTYTFNTPIAIPDGNLTYTTRIITVTAPFSSTAKNSITASMSDAQKTAKNAVAEDGTAISDVDLNINFTHTYLSDVQISIMSPEGTIVNLFDGSCGSASNTLSLKYDDAGTAISCAETTLQTVSPAGKLSAFNNESPYGDWTLMVRDIDAGQGGTINSASITIQAQKYTLGTDEVETALDFALFPNPNKGSFTIQFTPESNSGVQVLVSDILGRTIYSHAFEPSADFNENIQLSNVTSGIYLVSVIDGNRKTVKKIVIN